MAILITAEVPGQTEENYDRMLIALEPLLRAAKGFIAHGAGPIDGGWRTFEIWETPEDATRFFATHIHPNLPPGVTPRRSFLKLHSLVQTD
jgi:hypothetical protein